ncbi:MAG: hypothetical protein DRJ52_02335 [Thermoprotei archaeon]|nr:MAG: hypothetical protein DRJ52_02335 [Thermoprotei archaeon]RLE99992.1 MAG: hypothetical protein DRJ63_03735 [Thermoprotei archaeon]HDI74662.1 hypothetical protein [Thermoprotei archaeon]
MKASERTALIAVLTGLSVAFRFLKNSITQIQFVNIPVIFTIVGGYLGGASVGAAVGFFSFFLSDLMIAAGPWTFVDSFLAAAIGVAWGILGRKLSTKIQIFLAAFFSEFIYDILSSVVLYIVFGMDLVTALVIGIIGLFLPVCGGFILGVGPITELSTALLSSIIIPRVKEVWVVRYER